MSNDETAKLKRETLEKWARIAETLDLENRDRYYTDKEIRGQLPSLSRSTCGYCTIYGRQYSSGENPCDMTGRGCPLDTSTLCGGGLGKAYLRVASYDGNARDERLDERPSREHALAGARTIRDAILADIKKDEHTRTMALVQSAAGACKINTKDKENAMSYQPITRDELHEAVKAFCAECNESKEKCADKYCSLYETSFGKERPTKKTMLMRIYGWCCGCSGQHQDQNPDAVQNCAITQCPLHPYRHADMGVFSPSPKSRDKQEKRPWWVVFGDATRGLEKAFSGIAQKTEEYAAGASAHARKLLKENALWKWHGISWVLGEKSISNKDAIRLIPPINADTCGYCMAYNIKCEDCPLNTTRTCPHAVWDLAEFRDKNHTDSARATALASAEGLCRAIREDLAKEEAK
jgi:hypothetical protein